MSYKRNSRAEICRFVLLLAVVGMALFAAENLSVAATTVSFQEGVNGYSGTLDLFISADNGATFAGGDNNLLGSSVADGFFIDGPLDEIRGVELDPNGNPDPDQIDALMRFDNIFGNSPGQVPLGSKITDAKLIFNTSNIPGASSGGPPGIAQLLTPFNQLSTFNSLTDGISVTAGEADRPIDQGPQGVLLPTTVARVINAGDEVSGDVTRIVDDWSNGATNHGFLIRNGTKDGWAFMTSGAANTSLRPELEITYEAPTPGPAPTEVTFQQGLNGYTGTESVLINTPTGSAGLHSGTVDASTIDYGWVFYRPSTTDDSQILIQFNNLFVSEGGPIPDDATIEKAELVITTENSAFSTSSPTDTDFTVHEVLRDWDLTTPFEGGVFGFFGPDEAEGDIGPALDATGSVIWEGQALLDVTSAVTNWQGGAPNNGLNVQTGAAERAVGGSDAWLVHHVGAAQDLRPKLVVSYTTTLAGDFDGDGDVDGDDFLEWQRNPGIGVLADWEANYGSSVVAAMSTVPEPGTACMALILSALVLGGGRSIGRPKHH